jgi:hypothetical protein
MMAGKLVGRKEKNARRRFFTGFMAEQASYASKPNQLQQTSLCFVIHLRMAVGGQALKRIGWHCPHLSVFATHEP